MNPYFRFGAAMQGRWLRLVTLTILLTLLAELRADQTSPADRASAPKRRRILYNLDGDSCMFLKKGNKGPVAIAANDLRTIIQEITEPGSQVDTLLVCINAQVMYYPTKVGTMRGEDCTPDERKNWPASERQRHENIQAMFNSGSDPYAVLLAETRKRGLEALLTFRMNDAHGNDFLRTKFWRDHPKYRLGNGALDFRHDAVRDYVFRLIEEAVQRYGCDGIELDFQRFPTFFKDGTTEERIDKINGLVERVRKMLDAEGKKRKKRLVLGVRAPSDYGRSAPSYEKARQIGCDPVAWAKNGWVDFLTVSEFLHERYELPIRPWKQLIANVPIYGSIECAEGGKLEQCLTADKYRRAARHLWSDGADGVYLFNFFTTREWGKDALEPPFEVLKDIGDPKTIPSPEAPVFEIKVGQRQLFFDDLGVARLENLQPTMHRPVKRGAVIRSPDPAQTLQTRTAPVWNPATRRYLLWVLGIDQTLWESGDGLHWQPAHKPDLRIDMAVYDPNDANPARRFKAALLNEGFAVSPDGLRWTKLDVPKISSSDEGNFSYDPASGVFLHTVKRTGPFGRSVAVATSRDSHKWTDYGVVFHADEKDQKLGRKNIEARLADPTLEPLRFRDPKAYNVDVYNMGVFWYESLYVGLPAMYHAAGRIPNYPNTDGFHLVQLTCSRDLKTWTRLGDRQAFLGPSRIDSGAYDLTQIISPSAPVIHGDELWFYYTGLKYRSNFDYQGTYPTGRDVPVPGKDRDVGAVCLAVLRRDGFISLDAKKEPGTVTTKRFALPAGPLFVNVDARGGEFRAEVENENGQVVARSTVIRHDSPRQRIMWGHGDLAPLVGRRAALRFSMRDARFYSYWFER